MYEETVQRLFNLWTNACRERDEAREQLRRSIAESHELKKLLDITFLLSEEHKLHFPAGIPEETNHRYYNNYGYESPSQFSFTSPLDFVSFQGSSPGVSDSGFTADSYLVKSSLHSSNQTKFATQNRSDEYENIVLEILARGKVLPEKGKLLQAVIEAGPLLVSLLMAGPVPKWRNPPVQLSVRKTEFNRTFSRQNNSESWSAGKRVSDVSDFGSGTLHQPLPGKRTRFNLAP